MNPQIHHFLNHRNYEQNKIKSKIYNIQNKNKKHETNQREKIPSPPSKSNDSNPHEMWNDSEIVCERERERERFNRSLERKETEPYLQANELEQVVRDETETLANEQNTNVNIDSQTLEIATEIDHFHFDTQNPHPVSKTKKKKGQGGNRRKCIL